MKKVKSVRVRLFLTLSRVTSLIILLLVFTNSIVLESFYVYSKVHSVRRGYEEINNLYKNNGIIEADELKSIADKYNFELLIETDYDVIIYSGDQNLISAINKSKDSSKFTAFKNSHRRILYGGEKISITKISDDVLNCILLSGKMDNGYLIYIEVPIAAIEESVRISNNLLIIMGIIIAIVSAVISSVISMKFTKPILKLNEIANKMANLDFSEKYRVTDSDDEINELGKSINEMSNKLEKTIKQLRKNNNQLEKDIEEKSKIDEMRKQFISDVSHELKTPIALIQGYAEGLIENVNTDEESKKYYAEVILDESNKMDKLVKQLLELMTIEYGKRDFNNTKFNICELIQEVIRKCNVMLEETGAQVQFENTNPIYVYADEFYMDQVFTNYFTNAIKHVKEINGKKEIVIKTDINENNKKVRISVFNTGDNISEDNIQRIWGRFYKIDSSRNRNDGGTGIGLSLVKAIMNSYNSEYGVINKKDGVEFYFDIELIDIK